MVITRLEKGVESWENAGQRTQNHKWKKNEKC